MSDSVVPMSGWLEEAWLRRYLDRDLTPGETEWFEMYVLDKPSLTDRIDADNDLRDGLAAAGVQAMPANTTIVRIAPPARRSGGWTWFARAAGVVVSVTLGWWAATSLRQSPADVVIDPARIVFDTQRGAEDAPLVFNAASSSAYVLVEIGVPMDATGVELLQAAQPGRPLTVTSEGFVTFLWPRAAKHAGPSMPSLRYRTDGDIVTRTLDLSPALEGEAR